MDTSLNPHERGHFVYSKVGLGIGNLVQAHGKAANIQLTALARQGWTAINKSLGTTALQAMKTVTLWAILNPVARDQTLAMLPSLAAQRGPGSACLRIVAEAVADG